MANQALHQRRLRIDYVQSSVKRCRRVKGLIRLWNEGVRDLGFVANFAQKVVKGQLSLSVRRLSGERVELFGRSEAFFPSLNHHLFFPDHMHEFDLN